jgi:lactate permease
MTAAATNGAAFGLFPVGWIVLCAIFVYDITVKTGKFEEVRRTIAGLAVDRRILLLIAFSFGAFIEGPRGSAPRSSSARPCSSGSGPAAAGGRPVADRQHRPGRLGFILDRR